MSLLLPNTPEKGGGGGGGAAESASVRSISFSIPDTLSNYLGDNGNAPTTAASSVNGEASGWSMRDVIFSI